MSSEGHINDPALIWMKFSDHLIFAEGRRNGTLQTHSLLWFWSRVAGYLWSNVTVLLSSSRSGPVFSSLTVLQQSDSTSTGPVLLWCDRAAEWSTRFCSVQSTPEVVWGIKHSVCDVLCFLQLKQNSCLIKVIHEEKPTNKNNGDEENRTEPNHLFCCGWAHYIT